jgi:hypothetical protein
MVFKNRASRGYLTNIGDVIRYPTNPGAHQPDVSGNFSPRLQAGSALCSIAFELSSLHASWDEIASHLIATEALVASYKTQLRHECALVELQSKDDLLRVMAVADANSY